MSERKKEGAAVTAAKIGAVAAATYATGGTGTAATASATGMSAGASAGAGLGVTAGGAGGLMQIGAGTFDGASAVGATSGGELSAAEAGSATIAKSDGRTPGADAEERSASGRGGASNAGSDQSKTGQKSDALQADASSTKGPGKSEGSQDLKSESWPGSVGQGGTSMIDPAPGEPGEAAGGERQRADGITKGLRRTAVGGAAAGAAGPVMTMLMVLNWLKSLLMAAAQAAMGFLGWLANLAIGAWNGAMGFLGMVGSFFTSAGAAVGSALGVSAVAGTMSLVGVIVAGGLVAGGGLAASLTSQVTQQTDQVATSCILNAQQAAAVSNADPNGANATQLKNAQTLYSVLSAWGMPKENIAGILGNWEAESGIDPTSVQNNSAPVFQMSDAKKAAAGNTANGIGLGQWTAGRNTSLRNFATGAGKDWWTIETQLSYMMSPAEGANADVIRDMIKTSKGSPGAAALYFHQKWERSADDASQVQRRSDFADKWFALMSGWSSDKSLADSVLKQAGATLNAANQNQVAAAKSGCQSLNTTNVVLKDGGQDQADAQKLIDLYNSEGDAFLDGRYGQNGGPGSCGDNHAENCVSFSTYFLNKYTTFQQYPAGDGIDIASVVANATGKKLSSTPTAYAVGSGPGTSSSGHTLVVLGVKGNSVIVGEANFCQTMGRVRVTTVQELQSAGWKFVDMSDSMLPKDKVKTS